MRFDDDVEYAVLTVLRHHIYRTDRQGNERPDDPGWHPCTCGWEGYWSDYQPHVASHVTSDALGDTGTEYDPEMSEEWGVRHTEPLPAPDALGRTSRTRVTVVSTFAVAERLSGMRIPVRGKDHTIVRRNVTPWEEVA